MLKSYVVTADLLTFEPMLQDYYRTSQTDFSAILIDAQDILENDIKNRGLLLRNLCKTLPLTDTVKSSEDEIERTRLVINISAVTGTATFVFQGTNNESSETWITITTADTMSYTTTGEKNTTFSDTYKYYKITKTGTVTYTASLIERSFDLPKTYLAIGLIFKSFQSLVSDVWEQKAQFYMDKYEESLNRIRYSYDYNEDGTADKEEQKLNRVTFTR